MIDVHFKATYSRPTDWCALFPIKINVFLWRLKLHRLATKDNLVRRDVILQNNKCSWCDQFEETENHIFVSCDISKQVWSNVGVWLGTPVSSWNSMKDFWSWIDSNLLQGKKKMIVQCICFSALWNLWHLRISYIFNDTSFRIHHVMDNIIVTAFFWIFSRYKKGTINWSMWLQNPMDSL
ncbi:uncharacterized protein [Rutidosis leptorrhynchoides]|uniref:uncharacterized protein n=1 Tax=Rutidosis leptorrhynchoides TaxID=125765 RepID=UPI003A99CF48